MKKLIICIFVIFCGIMSACSEQNLDVAAKPMQTQAQEQNVESNQNVNYVVDPYSQYTYEMMLKDANELEDMYSEYIDVSSIGSSVEGRDITLIKMGVGETKILLIGSHHAREYISSTYLMNMADKYMYAFATDTPFGEYDLKSLLRKVTLYIVPMLNPDGVNLVINGKQSVQDVQAVSNMAMLKNTYAEWKANINGVDLNRQYPCFWEVKASSTYAPSSEMFKGSDSATEPEVKAIIKLCQNNDFVSAASFHTKGEIIYWADSGTVEKINFAEEMAGDLSAVTGYEIIPPSEDPAVYGAGFENWFRQEFGKPGFCIELTPADGTSLPHDDKKFDSLVWDKAKYIAAVLMKDSLLIEE